MNCQEARSNLYPYLDHELGANRERALFQHLAGCPGCQDELERARKLDGLLQESCTLLDPPLGFSRGILEHIPGAEPVVYPVRKPVKSKRWLAMAGAACLAIFSLVGLQLMEREPQTLVSEQTNPKPAVEESLVQRDVNQPPVTGPKQTEQQPQGSPEQSVPSNEDEGQPAADAVPEQQPAEGHDDPAVPPETSSPDDTKPAAPQQTEENEALDDANLWVLPEGFLPGRDLKDPTGQLEVAGGSLESQTPELTTVVQGKTLLPVWSGSNSARYLESVSGGYQVMEITLGQAQAQKLSQEPIELMPQKGLTWLGKTLIYTAGAEGQTVLKAWGETQIAELNGFAPLAGSGQKLLYQRPVPAGKELVLLDLAASAEKVLASGQSFTAAWSSDGKSVVYVLKNDQGVSLWQLADLSGAPHKVTDLAQDSQATAAFISENRLVLNVAGAEAGIWLVGADGEKQLLSGRGGGNLLSVSPDSRYIAFTDSKGALKVLYPQSGGQISLAEITTTGTVTALSWSPDSSKLLYQRQDPAGESLVMVAFPLGKP